MRLIAAVLIATLLASPALAGQAVTLRTDTATAGPITLGDLFDGAGKAAGIVVAPPVPQGAQVVLEAAIVQRAAFNAGLTWANEQGVRRIVVRSGAGASSTAPAAKGNVEALTWKRSLDAGEIVSAEDLTWAKLVAAPAGAPRDAEQLIGKAAKRPLREGSAASLRDVANPVVIKKDDLVTVTYIAGGISLTMQGKAVTTAALGEPVTILNTGSAKSIQAVASGVDQAMVGPQADILRAQAMTASPQIASR